MSLKKNSTNPKTSSGCWNLKLERLEVRDVPAVLVANADDGYVAFDGKLSVDSASGLLANDTLDNLPVEGGTVTLLAGSQTGPGTVTVHPNGSFVYNGSPDDFGEVSFDYQVSAGGETASARATLFLNHSPVGNSFTVQVTESDILLAPENLGFDPDGPSPSISPLIFPENGTIEFLEGRLLYTPNQGFTGTDSFTFIAIDEFGAESVPATITFVVGSGGENNAPFAEADNYFATPDTELTIDAVHGVLANDSDPNNDTLSAWLDIAPANGLLTLATDGSFTYTPNEGFLGTDTFTYFVDDARGGSALAAVTIRVQPPTTNTPPSALDAAFSVREDGGFGGVLLGADVDGDAITFAPVDAPANGRVVVNADGTFSYRPNPNFFGTDSFTFRTNDGQADSNLATVTITVRPVNDRPTLARAEFSVAENSPAGTSVGTIVGADVDGDALTYAITGGNRNGAFAIDPATGVITVANAAALDFETTRTFRLTVRVTDPSGRSDGARVVIRLLDVNENRRAALDIVPGDSQNRISLRDATVEVAILGAADLDVRQIDVDSLRFGRTGRENSIVRNNRGQAQFQLRDVNGDGRLDLVVRFNVDDTRLRVNDTRAVLTGDLFNGGELTGDGSVTVRR
ncbi:MAG: tandem-95 repeat protein [Planctomycetia bacterium]|nr:tandem-95 repeat protein [Planctomycetia bacterium]